MSFRDNLRKASFRGVPFWWEDVELDGGRRVVLHEYVQRDDAWPEDLGGKPNQYNVTAYVLGNDYLAQRDRLEAALKETGPGTLVHPTRGEIQVVAMPFKVRETTADGGKAMFQLQFVKAADNQYPAATQQTGQAVTLAADEAAELAIEDFEDGWSLDGPASLFDEATGLVDLAASGIEEAFSGPLMALSDAHDLLADIQGFRSDIMSLVRLPSSLGGRLLGLLRGFGGLGFGNLFGRRRSPLSGYRSLGGFGASLPPVGGSSSWRIQQGANQAGLVNLVRRGAAIEAARASSTIPLRSRDDAVLVRDQVTAQLDEVRTAPGTPDPVFRAVTELRGAVVRDMGSRGANLARVRQARLPSTVPSMVAAYRLLGDAGRAGELLDRNRPLIRHPGLVPGGVDLEVLDG